MPVAIALANKMARRIWAMRKKQQAFREPATVHEMEGATEPVTEVCQKATTSIGA